MNPAIPDSDRISTECCHDNIYFFLAMASLISRLHVCSQAALQTNIPSLISLMVSVDFKHQVYLLSLRLAHRTSYFLSFSTNPTPTICFVMKPHDPETKAQRALLSHSRFKPLAYKHQTLWVWLQRSHTPTCNYCFYVSSKLFKSNHHRSVTTTDQSGVSFSIWYWVCT